MGRLFDSFSESAYPSLEVYCNRVRPPFTYCPNPLWTISPSSPGICQPFPALFGLTTWLSFINRPALGLLIPAYLNFHPGEEWISDSQVTGRSNIYPSEFLYSDRNLLTLRLLRIPSPRTKHLASAGQYPPLLAGAYRATLLLRSNLF
jgi:hypothetical protein